MGGSAHIAWVKGGTADFLSVVDDVVELRSSIPLPPGARLDAMTEAEPKIKVVVKSYGSRREADGTFVIKGRLLEANRPLRDRLLALVVTEMQE